jgi:hypothetical protein
MSSVKYELVFFISHKTTFFIVTAVKTSELTCRMLSDAQGLVLCTFIPQGRAVHRDPPSLQGRSDKGAPIQWTRNSRFLLHFGR